MKKRTSYHWLTLFSFVIALLVVACGSNQGGNTSGGAPELNELPAPNPTEVSTVTVSFPMCPEGALCSALVTPGVPPGTIDTYGTIENGQCYDPHNVTCRVPRTAQVVGGNLNITYTVPVNTFLHIGFVLANQIRVDGIRINGILLTTFGALGTAPNQWPVACLIINRDQAGVVTVGGNPACTAQVSRLRLVITGDSGGSGAIGNYTNGTYSTPYDDTLVPYTGAKPGEDFRLQTSLWADPSPGGIWQQLVWDAAMNAYTETFFSVLNTQAASFNVHHPSREPTCAGATPACPYVPEFGIYADIMPAAGGAVQCTTQLVHYEDFDPTAAFWIGETTTGINTTTHCVTQGADTRGIVVSGP